MDNATIKLYKDGDDLIVVFKHASDDLLGVIQKALEAQITPIIIPDLEAPPEISEEPLNDLSCAECLIPERKVQTFSEFIKMMVGMKASPVDPAVKEACREYYESHDKILASVISTLEYNRVKGFVCNCYQLHDDLIIALYESGYPTIEEYVDEMAESDLRKTAQEIGNTVVSFFEAP